MTFLEEKKGMVWKLDDQKECLCDHHREKWLESKWSEWEKKNENGKNHQRKELKNHFFSFWSLNFCLAKEIHFHG